MTSNPNMIDNDALDLTGQTLGDYVMLRRLGRGGMAEVFLAEQISLNRQVAFKVLKPELAKDKQYVLRFLNEARAAAALVQANIVQIYEVGQTDGYHFIAQEYVRGQNLKQYLNRYGAVEPIMAINVLRQVTAALQKSSEHHIIHRDIKPENIMLAPNGEVKVTDFGLARLNNDKSKNDLTQIGITLGTPLYMSPEQVEGNTVDSRSDIYSLGITSYHMLAGTPPFDGENALAIAVQHVKNEPQPIHELRPDIPRELCDIITKMIAKKPEDRFQTAGELIRQLRKIQIDHEDWDALVDKLSDTETIGFGSSVTESRLAVTRQLETVMLGQLKPVWKKPLFWLALLVPFFLGVSVGTWNAQSQPVAEIFKPIDTEVFISKKNSVIEQYRHAVELDTEVAYEAVEEYFTDSGSATDNMYIWFSWERLGELYLRQGKWSSAMEIYEQLANLPSVETRARLVGLLGQQIVHEQQGRERESRLLEQSIDELELEYDNESDIEDIKRNFANIAGLEANSL